MQRSACYYYYYFILGNDSCTTICTTKYTTKREKEIKGQKKMNLNYNKWQNWGERYTKYDVV